MHPGPDLCESSLRQLREIKLAAAEIEYVLLLGEVLGEGGGEGVEALLTILLLVDQVSFAQHAQVLGHIVLREIKRFGNFVYAALLLHQHADDTQAVFFAERFHSGDAVELLHGWFLKQSVALSKPSHLNLATTGGRHTATFDLAGFTIAVRRDRFARAEVLFVVKCGGESC